MPYTLEGRALSSRRTNDGSIKGPCIFCGKKVTHYNDGGPGWILGAIVDGKPALFLYCDQPPCPAVDSTVIWRCGCQADYLENVGDRCHGCRCLRADAVPVP